MKTSDARTPIPRGALNAGDAAVYLGMSRTQLYRLMGRAEGIPSIKMGKMRLFRIMDLDAWLAARVAENE